MSHSTESIQFALNSEQRAIRDLAVSFAEERIAPFAVEWDQKKHFPRDVIASAAPLGLGGICVAEDVGGSAMSRLEAVLIYDGLAAGCPCIAGYFSVHNMVASIIDRYGSPEQRTEWLPRMCSLETLGAYCLSEPASGSDAAALTTHAVCDGDGYILNGVKQFISGAGDADVYVVMARTGAAGPRGISAFVVEKGTAGLSFGAVEKKDGLECASDAPGDIRRCSPAGGESARRGRQRIHDGDGGARWRKAQHRSLLSGRGAVSSDQGSRLYE